VPRVHLAGERGSAFPPAVPHWIAKLRLAPGDPPPCSGRNRLARCHRLSLAVLQPLTHAPPDRVLAAPPRSPVFPAPCGIGTCLSSIPASKHGVGIDTHITCVASLPHEPRLFGRPCGDGGGYILFRTGGVWGAQCFLPSFLPSFVRLNPTDQPAGSLSATAVLSGWMYGCMGTYDAGLRACPWGREAGEKHRIHGRSIALQSLVSPRTRALMTRARGGGGASWCVRKCCCCGGCLP